MKVKFKLIGFDYQNERYIMLTHDWLPCAEHVAIKHYGSEMIDAIMYEGPREWKTDMLNEIKEALSDIQQFHLKGIQSPCYYVQDTRMVCNTYTVIISN